MPLRVQNIADIIEEYAPLHYKESYDNVGLMIGSRKSEVTSILVALDCTLKVIDEAISENCNLIVTHHPLLFRKPQSITDDTLIGTKILKLIKNDINVYSCHTNLDAVNNGINDLITEVMGFEHGKILEVNNSLSKREEGSVQEIGIGRLVSLDESIRLDELCIRLKDRLEVKNLKYAGRDDLQIKRIAIINGSGQDYFDSALKAGADCIISGDTTYHYVSDYEEQNIAIIDPGHFPTEWPAMKLFAKYLQRKSAEMGFDNKIYISETNEDPYKYI